MDVVGLMRTSLVPWEELPLTDEQIVEEMMRVPAEERSVHKVVGFLLQLSGVTAQAGTEFTTIT